MLRVCPYPHTPLTAAHTLVARFPLATMLCAWAVQPDTSVLGWSRKGVPGSKAKRRAPLLKVQAQNQKDS